MCEKGYVMCEKGNVMCKKRNEAGDMLLKKGECPSTCGHQKQTGNRVEPQLAIAIELRVVLL